VHFACGHLLCNVRVIRGQGRYLVFPPPLVAFEQHLEGNVNIVESAQKSTQRRICVGLKSNDHHYRLDFIFVLIISIVIDVITVTIIVFIVITIVVVITILVVVAVVTIVVVVIIIVVIVIIIIIIINLFIT
jgi:hypothetical protein